MRKAFTLIELLMVIALIAIVSTLAVTKFGGLRDNSARKVSLANQVQISKAVESYLAFGHRGIDRLDSLIDDEVALGPGTGFFDPQGTTMARLGAGFYLGPDQDVTLPLSEEIAEKNSGLDLNLVDVLVPYSLSEEESRILNNWNFRYTMRHTTYANSSPRTAYNEKGDDGVYLPDDQNLGLDPNRSAAIPRAYTKGLIVAAISPFTPGGREIYRDFGQNLMDTKLSAAEYIADSGNVKAEVKATGGALLAFGLGERASIIGSQDAGIDTVPYAAFLNKKFYSRYILLFRIDSSLRSGIVTFAGVIDPCANTPRQAGIGIK